MPKTNAGNSSAGSMRLRSICFALAVFCFATTITCFAQTFNRISFNGTDGANPYFVALVQGRDGALYGTTSGGGAFGMGTVFRFTRNGSIQTIYNFCAQINCTDGSSPSAGLALGDDGNFYGTTYQGGANNDGTVFKVSPSGEFTSLYSFCSEANCADGEYPQARLLEGSDGNLYGATYWAGANANPSLLGEYDDGGGTIFKITPSGSLTTLHSFCAQSNCTDGASSLGGLIEGADGHFYGTTYIGGTGGNCAGQCGTIFKINTSGTLTTLYSFCSADRCLDGGTPQGGVLMTSDGSLFGATTYGGAYADFGTVFQFTPTGQLTTVHSFCYTAGCPDGIGPSAGFIQGSDGNLYDTTGLSASEGCEPTSGGGCGTIFSLTAGETFQTLYTFCIPNGQSGGRTGFHCPTGAGARGGVMQATDGNFYGVTELGAELSLTMPAGAGEVFEFSTGLGPFVSFVRPVGRVGQTVGILGQGFTGTTSVSLNGTPISFAVGSDTFLRATIPAGATTGYVTIATPSGILTSNVAFNVLP